MTKKAKKKGRPGRDYERLFQEWVVSGISKTNFLRNRGLNPKAGSVARATKDWRDRLKKVKKMVDAANVASNQRAEQMPAKDVREVAVMVPDPISGDALSDEELKEVAPRAWEIINQWRAKQAQTDWKMGDHLRDQIKLIIKNATKRVVRNGRASFETSLKPTDLRALADAAERVQRMQRLALGMSTENVGIPLGPDATVDGEDGPTGDDDGVPVFEVVMRDNGKFAAPRPRRVK